MKPQAFILRRGANSRILERYNRHELARFVRLNRGRPGFDVERIGTHAFGIHAPHRRLYNVKPC